MRSAIEGKARALRILVVEDDKDSRELTVELLRSTGEHAIAFAENAEDGLRCLRGESYDLVLTDIGLPDASGLDMFDQAKAEGCLVGAVVVVCTANQWLRQQALDRGALFILKPVDLETISSAVRSASYHEPSV